MNDQYKIAIQTRIRASENSAPEIYIQAGNMFVKLGMVSAAERCFDRADYYRKLRGIMLDKNE